MVSPEQHFDALAAQYDYWKSKNPYYYSALKALLRSHIPANAHVVEIGCGTGDLLYGLDPAIGRGIDVSEAMVALAKRRHVEHKNLLFERLDLTTTPGVLTEDYVFMTDVLEHVKPLPQFLENVSKSMKPGSRLVITLANPFWEWLLMLTEKLGMKMPEGPHWRLSIKENEELYRRAGFTLVEKGYRLLIPKRLPLSDWINARFYKNRFLAPWGFIVYWVLERK